MAARPERVRVERGIVLVRRAYASAAGERRRCATWTAYVHVDGRRYERRTGRRDQRAAEAVARRFRDAIERRTAGLPDWSDAQDADVPRLIAEWGRAMTGRGLTEGHIREMLLRVRAVLKGLTLAEVNPVLLRSRIDEIAAQPPITPKAFPNRHKNRGGAKLSPTTRNKYRGACYAFFAWLVEEGRAPHNPVEGVAMAKSTPKKTRRAITTEQLVDLVRVAPLDRGACYLLAACTGFRRSELKKIRWADLDLDRAAITLEAASTKARREAVQPLPAPVVEALRRYRAALVKGTFHPPKRAKPRPGWRDADVVLCPPTMRTYAEDLAAAGIDRGDHGRGVVDFHSLRGTLASSLRDLGVHPTTTQALMRHTDPKLTANVYTTVWDTNTREAVTKLGAALARAVPGEGPTAAPTAAPKAGPTGPTLAPESSNQPKSPPGVAAPNAVGSPAQGKKRRNA
jgi:integrase/recombinase XerC